MSRKYPLLMRLLLKIEEAADVLPTEQKKPLVAFLLTCLRGDADELSPVRDISKSTMQASVVDDEECRRKFLAGFVGIIPRQHHFT